MPDDNSLGDNRPDKAPLPGTVKLYERHLFICTGQSDWPARIEVGGGFSQAITEAMAPYLDEMALKVKVTACDEPSLRQPEIASGRYNQVQSNAYDLLLFPDGIRYLGVRPFDLPSLVKDHLVGGLVSDQIPHQTLTGKHVFVCVHGRRDERCGLCGPPLAARFQAELANRELLDQITVRRTSHVGGHAFAANVLIYPGGDWYGYVTPDDVPRLIDQHLLQGEIVSDLWRGRMGLGPEQQVEQAASW